MNKLTVSQADLAQHDRFIDQFEQLTTSCRRLTQTSQQETAYQVIVHQFAELATEGAMDPRVSLWVDDPLHHRLVLAAVRPESPDWLAIETLSRQDELAAAAAREHKTLIWTTVPAPLLRFFKPPVATSDTAVFIPLMVEERLVAFVLILCSDEEFAVFQKNRLAINLFTAQAALMVWNVLQHELVMFDHVTRAHNYAYFTKRIVQELQRCHRFGLPLSLLLIDIDDFKQINDLYGHQTGDGVLLTTAQVMQRSLRSTDLLARYGGDEFVILLPELGGDAARPSCDALLVAQRIRQAIAQHPFAFARRPMAVTVSVGVAIRPPHAPPTLDAAALFKQADEQLYRAKRAHKNQCAVLGAPLVGPRV